MPIETNVVPPAGSISVSINLELVLQSIPSKIPMVGIPFPISRFTKPNWFVVSVKVSWYTMVPPAITSWILIRTHTAWFCKISPVLSRTTAWYLKACGGCATIVDIVKNRNKIKHRFFMIINYLLFFIQFDTSKVCHLYCTIINTNTR